MLIPINILAIFLSTSIFLALAPGPDNILVLTQAAIRGRQAGLAITMGLCTGLIIHTLIVVTGIAIIFKVSIFAFTALKLIGGGYFLFLAYRTVRISTLSLNQSINGQISIIQLYKRGIIMNIANPKISIFFLSFLPQFADPSRGSVVFQILILGFIFILSAMLVFSMISVFAGYFRNLMQSSSMSQILLNYITGGVYTILAIKIIMTEI